MSLGKIVIQKEVYLINTCVSLQLQEDTINRILAHYPSGTPWEWFDECSFDDVL